MNNNKSIRWGDKYELIQGEIVKTPVTNEELDFIDKLPMKEMNVPNAEKQVRIILDSIRAKYA